jgi:hypothetical protein
MDVTWGSRGRLGLVSLDDDASEKPCWGEIVQSRQGRSQGARGRGHKRPGIIRSVG